VDTAQLDDGTTRSFLNSYLRVFAAPGFQLAANDDAPDPDTGIFGPDSALTCVAPTTGVYNVAVSGSPNFAYDPNSAGSGTPANTTGQYILQLTKTGPN